MSEDQKKLQTLSDAYQKLQTGAPTPLPTPFLKPSSLTLPCPNPDLQTVVGARQKLESQQQENQAVQKEFSTLPSSSNIYKLVGPVLLKQERNEAVMAVEARLEFIGSEIKRVEGQIGEMQQESEGKKMEVFQLQSQMQGNQQA